MSRKKLISFGFALVIIGIAMAYGYLRQPGESPKDTYKVAEVVDGDTIKIERYGKSETVRLIGIDTPETVDPRKQVQCYGKEASDYSKSLMTGKSVRIEFDPLVGERDKYYRLLAYVWLDENQLVNQMLVNGGYAHEYTYRSQAYKYQTEFKKNEEAARVAGSGLWSEASCSGNTK